MSGAVDTGNYENKYAILADNLHDRYGMLPTLDKIVQETDIVILDTPLIPTVYKDISRLQPRQARNVCFLYKALEDIFASPKVRVHPSIFSEMKSLLATEQGAAQQLGSDVDFQRYRQAIARLMANLPKPTPVQQEHTVIFGEFLNALNYIDSSLEIRHNKRHNHGPPTTVDLHNLAYALTLSVTNSEKSHVLLSRDIDHERLFDKSIELAYSFNFSAKNRNGETVPQQLGNPKFMISYCDQEKKNQPFSIVRNTASTPVGTEFSWESNAGKETQEKIIENLRLNLFKVVYELQRLRQVKQSAVATLPVVSAASLNREAIRNLYEAMRVTKEEIAHKHEQGRLGAVLEGYCTVYALAKQGNDEKTRADMETDLKAIEKYLLVAQRKEAITEHNVNKMDMAGELEQLIEQQRKLRETASFLGMDDLARAAGQSLGIAKGYIKRMQPAAKANVHDLGKEVESATKELGDLREKQKRWMEKDAYYERLKESLKGEVAVDLNIVVAGQPDPKRVEGREMFGDLIYKNLCHVLGHAPNEGESVGKKQLVASLGISRTRFSEVVKRAGVGNQEIPLGKGDSSFAFSREVINKVGSVLGKRPPELK